MAQERLTLMNPQLQTLIELQKIDSEIAELEQGKAAIPRQIESGRAGIEEKTDPVEGGRG